MSTEPAVDRRTFVAGATAVGLFSIAGCTNDPQEEDEQGGSPQDEGNRPADEGGEGETTTLRVTVETEDGDPIEGATVAIEGEEYQDERETEPDGTVLFEDIGPGQYSIDATAEEYGTAESGVDLEGGESEEIELTLPDERGAQDEASDESS